MFEIIGKPARSTTCEAIQGLTAEMDEDLDFGESPAADALLIACAQGWSTMRLPATACSRRGPVSLGEDAAKLLDETLQEEKKTDELQRNELECRSK